MANDPRTFLVKPCLNENLRKTTAASRKKGFLDNITKIGDLEFLNDVGGGDVGRGLRTLSAVSDSIRTGKSAVPGREGDETYNTTLGRIANTARNAVNEGAQVVLDTTGLGTAVKSVGELNTDAANRAYEAGKQVFERVKDGDFELEDIAEVFSDLQNVETLARGIFGGSGSPGGERQRELCGASPYAMDLIAFAPKQQFLFIIEIEFAPAYNQWNENARQTAFVIKTSSRPKFNIDYEEVNMYGFRTRVPRKVEYQPMGMSFIDDNKNAAHEFYVSYMRAMSPIANWKNKSPQDGQYERSGMDFGRTPQSWTFAPNVSPQTLSHSASLGPLDNSTTSLIKEIRLHHVFDYGNKMTTYYFFNPRITSFMPSDLTMAESGEGCSYEFEFNYDGIYIDHMIDLNSYPTRLKDLTKTYGTRPIDPVYSDSKTGLVSNGKPTVDDAEQDPPTSFLGGIKENLASAADGITDKFGNIIGGVENIAGQISGQFDALISGAQSGIDNISRGITGGINQAIGAASKNAGDLITNAIGGNKANTQLMSEVQAAKERVANFSPQQKADAKKAQDERIARARKAGLIPDINPNV